MNNEIRQRLSEVTYVKPSSYRRNRLINLLNTVCCNDVSIQDGILNGVYQRYHSTVSIVYRIPLTRANIIILNSIASEYLHKDTPTGNVMLHGVLASKEHLVSIFSDFLMDAVKYELSQMTLESYGIDRALLERLQSNFKYGCNSMLLCTVYGTILNRIYNNKDVVNVLNSPVYKSEVKQFQDFILHLLEGSYNQYVTITDITLKALVKELSMYINHVIYEFLNKVNEPEQKSQCTMSKPNLKEEKKEETVSNDSSLNDELDLSQYALTPVIINGLQYEFYEATPQLLELLQDFKLTELPKNEPYRIYLASPFFDAGGYTKTGTVAKIIRDHFGDKVEVYVPQENDSINDKSKEVTNEQIFNADLQRLHEADMLLCDLDGLVIDPGVACEIGIFSQMCEEDCSKKILGYMSDMRGLGKGAGRLYRNQFVLGAIEENGKIIYTNPSAFEVTIKTCIVQYIKEMME